MKPYYSEAGIEIYHGDCREVLPELGAVDHIITDPPYGRDVYVRMRKADSASSTAHKVKNGSDLRKLAAGAIGAGDHLVSPSSIEFARLARRWGLVFSDAETTWLWRENLEAAGLRYVRTGAWVKPNAMPQMTGDRPGVGFEPCTIAHAQGAMRWNGGGHAGVWTHNTCKVDRPDHPCPKPLPLMTQLVSLFTDPGEIVLDPFMGSGTTLKGAKRLNRRAIGIEIEEQYCEVAARELGQSVMNFGQGRP